MGGVIAILILILIQALLSLVLMSISHAWSVAGPPGLAVAEAGEAGEEGSRRVEGPGPGSVAVFWRLWKAERPLQLQLQLQSQPQL